MAALKIVSGRVSGAEGAGVLGDDSELSRDHARIGDGRGRSAVVRYFVGELDLEG